MLTNDGDLAFTLTHPKFRIKKVYFVKTDRELRGEEIRKVIETGVEEGGEVLKADALTFKYMDGKCFCYEVDLHEGKNRHIRRIFEALGASVIQLKRLQFAAVKLGGLDYGKIRELQQKEIEELKRYSI